MVGLSSTGKTWRLYCESGMIPKWQDIQPTAETRPIQSTARTNTGSLNWKLMSAPTPLMTEQLKLWVEADRSFLQGLDWVAWKIALRGGGLHYWANSEVWYHKSQPRYRRS